MRYIKVPRKDTEKIKEKVYEMDILDDDFKIIVDEHFGYIPVKKYVDGYEIVEFDGERRIKNETPYQKIRRMFPIKECSDILPNKWEKFGDVVLVKLNDELLKCKYEIGKTYAEVLNAKSVINYHYVKGELREPVGELIFGNDPVTIHLENGIYYKFDALRIMFSSGNVDERIRISRMNLLDMNIVDMFAGIGYFSLPAAKYGFPRNIISIEKNPISYHYLKENIKINNIKNIIPILGDNREVKIHDWADLVIMGYIHTSDFIDHGIRMLKRKGIIIYHDTFRKDELKNLDKKIEEYFGKYQYYILRKHVVKSYAPSIYHVVLDIFLRKL